MTNDNTKAFPASSVLYPDGTIMELGAAGMDLRDYFAAKIMQSLVRDFQSDAEWNAYEQASFAYTIADAMMQERKK